MPDFLTVMNDWKGYRHVGTKLSEAALTAALDLITNRSGMPSHRREYLLREAVTTDDFPMLFGQVLDRSILARYRTAPSPWRNYLKVATMRDFRVGELHKVQGQDSILPLVPQKTEYPETPSSNSHYHRQLFKRGRKFDISWEALINDGMNAFGDVPQRFADAALNTEALVASNIYCGAAAPSTGLFGAPIVDVDGQSITNLGSLPLTAANLIITLGLMAGQTDVQGMPLSIRGVNLVVPPLLEITARTILTSAYFQQVDTAGGANAVSPVYVPLPTTNILPQMGIQLHVDPMIPVAMPVAAAHRTWFLFAGGSQFGQMEFLQGHEAPEICMKASDKLSISGGTVSALEGDFDTDDVRYRVRHCLGGTQADPRYAYAQVGP